MADGIEIERKFLLGELPSALAFARRRAILQGYLAIDGDTEVRVRRTPDGSTLTIKHGSGEVRVEEELELGERQADALWELTEGRRLQKVRRVMRVEGHDVEVDEYAGALDGLVVAEVEFIDEDVVAGVRGAGVVRARDHRRSRLRQPQPQHVRLARRQARLTARQRLPPAPPRRPRTAARAGRPARRRRQPGPPWRAGRAISCDRNDKHERDSYAWAYRDG